MAAGLQTRVPSMGAVRRGMNVSAKLLGGKEMAELIRKMTPAARKAMADQFEREARILIDRIQHRYVPVDKGDLAFSGHVDRRGGMYPSVEFGFGSTIGTKNTAAYAVVQHENTWFRHPAGGQAKYVLQPVMRAQKGILDRVGKAIRVEFAKHDTRRFE